jgi:hypothetical protein
MEPEIAPHDAKRNLIETALSKLQDARDIDERDSLKVENWIDWYDRTIPLVTEIKIIAGAMEVELSKRRGMRLETQPEQLFQRVTPGVTLSVSERKARSKDRALGRNPAAVDDYIKTEAHARRVPTRKGALRHVKGLAGRPASRPKSRRPSRPVRATPSTPSNESATNAWIGAQARAAMWAARALDALDTIADGERRTDPELSQAIGFEVEDYLRRVRLIPWLSLDRLPEGTVFTIQEELRAICDGRMARPDLEGGSVKAFLTHVRSEIIRRRQENLDGFQKAGWSTNTIFVREHSDLLDWIEEQLNGVAVAGRVLREFLTHLRGEITRRRKENHDEFRKRRWTSEAILRPKQIDLLDWIEQQLDQVPC